MKLLRNLIFAAWISAMAVTFWRLYEAETFAESSHRVFLFGMANGVGMIALSLTESWLKKRRAA